MQRTTTLFKTITTFSQDLLQCTSGHGDRRSICYPSAGDTIYPCRVVQGEDPSRKQIENEKIDILLSAVKQEISRKILIGMLKLLKRSCSKGYNSLVDFAAALLRMKVQREWRL